MKIEKCGIYKISCLCNGRIYVGSSKQIYTRWSQHRYVLRRGKSTSRYLQNSWTKHGEDAFQFSIMEECDKELLEVREQFYIDELRPRFNSVVDVKRRHSPKARAKIVAASRARAARRTHCRHGHLYDETNTYFGKKGEKICRACNADRVSKIYDSETSEQRQARRIRARDGYKRNRGQRLEKMREYIAANKTKKSDYDRAHRAESNKRKRERRENETSEKRAERLKKKRISHHRRLGRGDVDTWQHPPISEEQKAKISATLKARDRPPAKEPWVAEGISKTTYYRRLKEGRKERI